MPPTGDDMYLLVLAIALTLLKYFEIAPIAAWPWWWVVLPYGLTLAWWTWADASGYTKRREIDKIEQRKQDRVNKQKEAMGMQPRKRR